MASDDFKLTSLSLWQKAAAFGAAYFLCAEASSYLLARGGTSISFWLPAGLSVAVLLLNRTRDWPWFLLAALPANFIFDLLHDPKPNPAVILLFYGANVIQTVAGAWLVRRFVAERPTLATLKEFAGLLGFAAVFSTIPGAVIGAATLVYSGLSQSFEQSWEIWWGSNAVAILVFTSFILTWFSKSKGARNDFSPPKKIAEAVLLLLGLIIFESFLFYRGRGMISMNRSWAVPLLLWAGLRFGSRGATAVSLLFTVSMAFFTAQFSIGLTAAQVLSGEYIFPMQMILVMGSLVALIPAIVIGERDRIMGQLRESEERFKNLSAAAFEGICISENGRILDVNNQLLTMFGYERAEIIGHQIIELIAPESRELVAEAIRIGRETIYGHQLLRKDGGVFFAEAQAKMVRIGDRTLRMTALRDITERRRAEETLRNSETLFRSYFELAMVGCAISSLEKDMIAVNDQFCQMTGYTREELQKKTWVQLTHPDDIAADVAQFNRVLAGEIDSYVLDKRYIRKDGREVFVTISVRCVRHADGSPDYFIGLVMDITDRHEAILREQRVRAEYTFQLIASQEAERARIARELHDSLGQNLLLIKNRTQLELTKKNLSDDMREPFQSISDIASQAIAEARHIAHDLHPHQLDLLGLTRALRALIDNTGESSGMVIDGKFDSVDDLFSREAATNIYRIVQESLNNILKHSHAKNAGITLERDVHEVVLKIEDDGCGFKTDKAENGGKGLGLKNIVERVRMLGGKIKLDSQPAHGTRIEITIPISAEQR
ncbi:MAG: PAS domain S-box protein [Verrucomicrobiota bacterium]|jgi:PAS domain S-box-containing protein